MGNATFPVRYTDRQTKKITWARRRGLRIQRTTNRATCDRWKAEMGLGELPSIRKGVSGFLQAWAKEILEDKADLAAVVAGQLKEVIIPVDNAAVSDELIRNGIDIPAVEELGDEVADDGVLVPGF